MEYLPVFVYSIKYLISSINFAAISAPLRYGLINCLVLIEKRLSFN